MLLHAQCLTDIIPTLLFLSPGKSSSFLFSVCIYTHTRYRGGSTYCGYAQRCLGGMNYTINGFPTGTPENSVDRCNYMRSRPGGANAGFCQCYNDTIGDLHCEMGPVCQDLRTAAEVNVTVRWHVMAVNFVSSKANVTCIPYDLR